MANDAQVYPYLVDPDRLDRVYGSGDLELERAVFAGSNWPPEFEKVSEDDFDQALDAIINGNELQAKHRVRYTLVLEHVCQALGTLATGGCEHDDPDILAGDIIHFINEALRRLGAPELMPIAYPAHPFLPDLELTIGSPTIEVYAATDCARVARVLRARWSDLTLDDRSVAKPMLRLLDKRRLHDVLVLFSY